MSLTITRSGRQADRRYGGRSHCEAVQPPKQSWRCGKEPRIAHPASAQKVWRTYDSATKSPRVMRGVRQTFI
jgi:hypothetical protein